MTTSPLALAPRSEAGGAVTEQLRELGITVHFQPVGGVATV